LFSIATLFYPVQEKAHATLSMNSSSSNATDPSSDDWPMFHHDPGFLIIINTSFQVALKI
jgi:hypothetical protein